MRHAALVTLCLAASASWGVDRALASTQYQFDHRYRAYGAILDRHLFDGRVDYQALQRDRAALDAVVDDLGRVTRRDLDSWTEPRQIAYWINAYNVFTLQAIVDHYPIDASWFSWPPWNSIRQIDGVWDERRWTAAGAEMTLDEIEHETLRTRYREPRIHFAVNCASVSCPPLRPEPYVGDRLERQLILATRDFLASDLGLQVSGNTLRVSKIFDWYGEDFVEQYGHLVDGPSPKDRAILGVIAIYGPTEASQLAQSGRARLRFLRYDWSLNDVGER